tara:strand:- start:215 stop:427 length:213 start_codon:yes stop_codon:yes gene_type:complete
MNDKWMALKQLKKEIYNKEMEIKELHVLIDTLQTNLRSAISYLSEEQAEEIKKVPSMKWCVDWSPKNLEE